MQLISARREFISLVAQPDGSLEGRYQVYAVGQSVTFDQELQVLLRPGGEATAYMQIEDVPSRGDQESAVQRLADHLEMMAKALRATDVRKRSVKTRAFPIHLRGETAMVAKPKPKDKP